MSDPSLVAALTASAGGVVVVMAGTALVSRRSGKAAYVDAAWGASFVVAAWAAMATVLASGHDGSWRAWLLLALVTVWGGRLTWHLGRRVRAHAHDDPRYETYLGGALSTVPFTRVVVKVFVLQGVLVYIVALPVVLGLVREVAVGWLVPIGLVLGVLGMVWEAVADAQLAAYRALPDRPRILSTGLWAWSRHPNYFGDFCLWWGLWLVGGAASGFPSAWQSLIAPILMSWILIGVSGVRLAEERMKGRPGWTAYCARTPVFFPRPPRRS